MVEISQLWGYQEAAEAWRTLGGSQGLGGGGSGAVRVLGAVGVSVLWESRGL